MAFRCAVCGVRMPVDWPSGVCSVACLNRGQGFDPAPVLAEGDVDHDAEDRRACQEERNVPPWKGEFS